MQVLQTEGDDLKARYAREIDEFKTALTNERYNSFTAWERVGATELQRNNVLSILESLNVKSQVQREEIDDLRNQTNALFVQMTQIQAEANALLIAAAAERNRLNGMLHAIATQRDNLAQENQQLRAAPTRVDALSKANKDLLKENERLRKMNENLRKANEDILEQQEVLERQMEEAMCRETKAGNHGSATSTKQDPIP